jgi:hypothetical protein
VDNPTFLYNLRKIKIPISLSVYIIYGKSKFLSVIKRIGRRWSDVGLLKWCMVVVLKIFYPSNWDIFWKQYLKINKPISILEQYVTFQWL